MHDVVATPTAGDGGRCGRRSRAHVVRGGCDRRGVDRLERLGAVALDLGDGYLTHGTWSGNRDSTGTYASHGRIRMYDDAVGKLAGMVDPGTPVIIRRPDG